MAERRMFSKRIISGARFLKMPISTQLLYFHLGMQADDDGIVEAYTVINSIGATEDDLKILVGKGFVTVLNEDWVTYINDWRENNKLRADRKIDSIHKDLLLKIIPDVSLLETKERSDRKNKEWDGQRTTNGQSTDGQRTTNGQSTDGQRTTNGRTMDGIGKDRIGKDRIGKDSNTYGDSEADYELFFEEVWEKYPRKKGKGSISAGTKKRLYKEVGLEQMLRCVERYKKYISDHNITEEYIKYGSSFFNSGYMDYLDKNYLEKPKEEVKEPEKPTYFDCYGLAHPTDVEDYARFDRFRNLTKEEIQHFVDKGNFNMVTGGLDGLYLTKEEIKLLQDKGVV